MRCSCLGVARTFATVAVAFALHAPALFAQGKTYSESFYVDNTGANPLWGQAEDTWEHMLGTPALDDTSMCALDPDHPYFACSDELCTLGESHHCWAEIWLGNAFEQHPPPQVDVELWTGTWLNEYSKVAVATRTVNNAMPGQMFPFDFGVIRMNGHICLILKIIYRGEPGNTHVYWDTQAYPTGLHKEGPIGIDAATWGKVKALYRE